MADEDDAYDAAIGHTASTATNHDDGQTFDVAAWAAEAADENIDPEVLAALLDVETIREEHGEVTKELLRRHVAAVNQLSRMFGHHREDP